MERNIVKSILLLLFFSIIHKKIFIMCHYVSFTMCKFSVANSFQNLCVTLVGWKKRETNFSDLHVHDI